VVQAADLDGDLQACDAAELLFLLTEGDVDADNMHDDGASDAGSDRRSLDRSYASASDSEEDGGGKQDEEGGMGPAKLAVRRPSVSFAVPSSNATQQQQQQAQPPARKPKRKPLTLESFVTVAKVRVLDPKTPLPAPAAAPGEALLDMPAFGDVFSLPASPGASPAAAPIYAPHTPRDPHPWLVAVQQTFATLATPAALASASGPDGALVPASAAAPGPDGAGSEAVTAGLLLEAGRVPQALAALGLPQPSTVVGLLLRKHAQPRPQGDTSYMPAAPSSDAEGPSGGFLSGRLGRLTGKGKASAERPVDTTFTSAYLPLGDLAFQAMVNDLVLDAFQTGRAGLSSLAEGRLRAALEYALEADRPTAAGTMGVGVLLSKPVLNADDIRLVKRGTLARALLRRCPLACLSPAEAAAVAAWVPGRYQQAAVSAIQAVMEDNTQAYADPGKARLAPIAALNRLTTLGSSEDAADVSVGRFLAWIRVLAAAGACVFELPIASPAGSSNERPVSVRRSTSTNNLNGASSTPGKSLPQGFVGVFAEAAKRLCPDPLASTGVAKLCGLVMGMPGNQYRLVTSSQRVRAALGSLSWTSTLAFDPWFQLQLLPGNPFLLLCMDNRIPRSFHPSRLGSLASNVQTLSLGGWLLDGGVEPDSGGLWKLQAPQDIHKTPFQFLGLDPVTPKEKALSSAQTAQAQRCGDMLGLELRQRSILKQTVPLIASGPPRTGKNAADAKTAKVPQLRTIGAAACKQDMSWAIETSSPAPTTSTIMLQLDDAEGIPCPLDERVRADIRARILRVCVVEGISPPDEFHAPRMRLLSNVYSVPAVWSPLKEDCWVFPEATAALPWSKLIIRCEPPRHPREAHVLFEFNTVFASGANPIDIASAIPGITNDSIAVGEPDCDMEVTCCWGVVPLSSFLPSSNSTSANDLPFMQFSSIAKELKVTLMGGSPTASADMFPADILVRRAGLQAIGKSLKSKGPIVSALNVKSKSLGALSISERQSLARLPINAILPFAHVSIVDTWRSGAAAKILQDGGSLVRMSSVPLTTLASAARILAGCGMQSSHAALSLIATEFARDLENAKVCASLSVHLSVFSFQFAF
jgi:hypothetical protein